MCNIIKLENISKTFDRIILNNLSLNIIKEKITVIIGKSGSGKTTLLNILGLNDFDYDGKYYLNNKDVSKIKPNAVSKIRNEELGFIFQSYNLINHLTVYDNLVLPILYSKKPYNEDYKHKINAILSDLNISHLLNQKTLTLSGGEKQRVAIARTILMDSLIVIADEPTGNLDLENRNIILNYFITLKNKYHKTIIIVTHDSNLADIADYKYELIDGKLYERQ